MSGDRLARIEGGFTGTYAHYLTGEESEALLALVEIAEAARGVIEAADDARPRYELPLCADALRSALAGLDSGAAEGDA